MATARDKERRKRRVGQPLLVPGLCLPKALQPVLPIYLQGVLQVRFWPLGLWLWRTFAPKQRAGLLLRSFTPAKQLC